MIVETTVLSVILVCEAARHRCENLRVEFDSLPSRCAIIEEELIEPIIAVGYTDITEQMLAKDFGAIQQVRYVLTEDISDTLLVWIVLEDPSQAVRQRIYEKELSLISEFPNIPFDFNLIPAMGRTPENIVTGARIVYSRPE